MTRRRAARRIPGWAIGLTLTVFALVPAWIRPASPGGIAEQLVGLRLEWSGPPAPAEG